MAAAEDQQQPQTHYQVLGLTSECDLSDIKKAYRKLALQHHPDRHPPAERDAATVVFRRVNEAYEVLSDPAQRRQYDEDLKDYNSAGSGTTFGRGNRPSTAFYRPAAAGHHPGRHYRDPFHQFNDLFRNDPFFQEAFRDLDDRFAQTFQQNQPSSRNVANPPKQPRSWGRWIADCLGVDVSFSTRTTRMGPDGRPITSRTESHYGKNHAQNQDRTYTSKSTRTTIVNGQRFTVQSLEKDGNKIEEHYNHDNELVQRLINGIPEPQYRLQANNNNNEDL